jgi:hypothetical protein
MVAEERRSQKWKAREIMDARGVDGFGQGHGRQDGGEPPGQHRPARSRGAEYGGCWAARLYGIPLYTMAAAAPRQRSCFLGVASYPQGEATHPRILPIHEDMGAGLLRDIVPDALLGRLLGCGNLSQGNYGKGRCRQPPMGRRCHARSASWAQMGFPAPPLSNTMQGE